MTSIHTSLYFLGGYREQGRSCLALEVDNDIYLFDVGIKKTYKEGYYGEPPYIDLIDPSKIKALFISHLHEDHIVMAPYLVKKGLNGPIYMNKPTYELGSKYWYKWAKIFEEDGRKIYTLEDVDETKKLVKIIKEGENIDEHNIRVKFYPSGHALGSTLIDVELSNGYSILYLADIASGSNTLVDPIIPNKKYNIVIINSSYGDKIIDRENSESIFVKQVIDVVRKGGIALVPVTGIGRGQETLSIFLKYIDCVKELKDLMIYIEDTIEKGFDVFKEYQEYMNPWFKKIVKKKIYKKKPIQSFKQDEVNDILKNGPSIILATDLMLMGFSRKVFMKIKDDPRSAVFLTGYQAPGTFGRKLKDAISSQAFVYDGEVIVFKCKIFVTPIKMHFDLVDNLRTLQKCGGNEIEYIILHHGEEPNSLNLAYYLSKVFEPSRIVLPSVPSRLFIHVR